MPYMRFNVFETKQYRELVTLSISEKQKKRPAIFLFLKKKKIYKERENL